MRSSRKVCWFLYRFLYALKCRSLGLRVHGPIPTFLERLAPHSEDLDILGYKMPPGTVIGTQSWSMHRDGNTFSDPEVFNIFRWLDADQPQETMSQLLIPFGIGPIICVGQHLARNAIKTMLAATIRNFDILPCSETNDRTMEMMELFVRTFIVLQTYLRTELNHRGCSQ